MQHVQSRARSRRWIGRGGLASVAALVAFGVSPALPALAGSWSGPVQLPGSCGSSVAVNQAGAMAAGGTFTAADGTTHVQVCTSPDGTTWQATDLGPGGDEPHGGQHPVVALSPDGHVVAVWGSTVGVQAAVRPPGDGWTTPETLTGGLNDVSGGIVLGMDGAGNAIAAWAGFYAGASHYAVLPAGLRHFGKVQTLSTSNAQGTAHNLGLAVSPNGNVVIAFATNRDAIWAASGTIAGGLSAPVFVAAADYSNVSAPRAALDDAGQASLIWSQTTRTEVATRSPSGTWSAATTILHARRAGLGSPTALRGSPFVA